MTVLIFGSPLAKANNQHSKRNVASPESVSLTWFYHEFVVSLGPMYFLIYL